MRRWIVTLWMMAGCGFQSTAMNAAGTDAAPGGSDAGSSGDAGGSTAMPIDSPPPPVCFGSYQPVCLAPGTPMPTMAVMLTADIDTDSTSACDQHNDQKTDYCVVMGASITVPDRAMVRAFGSKPLVLVAVGTFELMGTIDVSSTSKLAAHPDGAGAGTPAMCNAGATPPDGSSGGYGGSFGGPGGKGQRQGSGAQPMAGGAIDFPAKLRAGCPGGDGSSPAPAVALPGQGGAGGGAVSVIANEIHLNGVIDASGAGGIGGGTSKVGAGGGGSGGMIVLDASKITSGPAVALFANGGGGGQGGTFGVIIVGDGGDESTSPTMPGAGGNNRKTPGGAGGNGSADTNQSGSDASSDDLDDNAGGGAGGGGAGYVRAPGVTMNISPPSR